MDIEKKTLDALRWIVDILNTHSVPYSIGGGFAAKIYGSPRLLNDIDISISGKHFSEIISDISDFIVEGPLHVRDEKWDCIAIVLDYHSQIIDISDSDTLRMSNKARTEWIQYKERFNSFKSIPVEVKGISLWLDHPRELVEYKKELDGEHQDIDIKAVQKFISNTDL